MENKNIEKPITLIKEEFTQELIQLVNNSKLPMFVIEPILKDVLTEVHSVTLQQLEADKKNYQESLKSIEKAGE
jgi:hypothetical protein